jgi:hypothetical protein
MLTIVQMTPKYHLPFFESVGAAFLIIPAVALSWIVIVFLNNQILFRWTALDSWVHLIYFPAGFKLIVIMLFGLRGAIGIFAGTIYNFFGIFPFLSPEKIVALAGIYAAAPLAALQVFELLTGRHYPWRDLRFFDIFLLSILTSIASSLSILIGLRILSGQHTDIMSFIYFIFGDLLGIIIFFLLIAAGIKIFNCLRTSIVRP